MKQTEKIRQEVLKELDKKDMYWDTTTEKERLANLVIDLAISKTRHDCEVEIDRRIRAYNKSMTPVWKLREQKVKDQTISEVREWLLEMKHKHAGLSHEGYINWMIVEFDKKFGKVKP